MQELANNERLDAFFNGLRHADDLTQWAKSFLHEDITWNVAHPVNTLIGVDSVVDGFLRPLIESLPDVERNALISIDSTYGDGEWVNGTGYLVGVMEGDLFGIPHHGKPMNLRYTEMIKFDEGKIIEAYIIPDFIEVMEQVGCSPLRESLGAANAMLPPVRGAKTSASKAYEAEGIKLVEDMLDCLRQFDGKSLTSMNLADFWYDDFMWYGPGGIGTTRGIDGFRQRHQGPFVFSFPDRDVDNTLNIIANGDFISTGGWPHMSGCHTGSGGWLGLPPTGVSVKLRVMDVWRREGPKLKENWVAIDICHIALQLGLDVFEQMKKITNQGVRYD